MACKPFRRAWAWAPPKSKPKPKQAILRRRKPFGQAKNATQSNGGTCIEASHVDHIEQISLEPSSAILLLSHWYFAIQFVQPKYNFKFCAIKSTSGLLDILRHANDESIFPRSPKLEVASSEIRRPRLDIVACLAAIRDAMHHVSHSFLPIISRARAITQAVRVTGLSTAIDSAGGDSLSGGAAGGDYPDSLRRLQFSTSLRTRTPSESATFHSTGVDAANISRHVIAGHCSELGNGCSSFPLPPILEGVLRVSGQDSVFTMMHHTQTTVSRMLDATDADNSRSRPLLRTKGKHPGSHCTQFRAFNRRDDLSDAAQRARRAATPRIFAIGFIRGDGERWGGSAFLSQKAAEHDPRCRRSSRPSTISADASSAGGRAAYAPPCGARTFYCKQEHHCKFDKSAPDSSGSDPAVAPDGSCNNHANLSHDDDTGASEARQIIVPVRLSTIIIHVLCMKIETTRLTQLAMLTRSFRWKRCVKLSSSTLLTTPPAFELSQKYFGIVFPWAEENGLIDDGSASTTTAPAVSAVAHLSFAGAQLAGVRDLDDVGVGVQRLEERDGLLGFGEGLGGRGNDEKDLFDLLDAVAAGEADEVSAETTGR
ncbi:hypothetical protein FB451DRAFT_1379781 [Mycena latifolia]|nr:hypothetical protein FB451DRAFT_1379781 [Mycena latifolia]